MGPTLSRKVLAGLWILVARGATQLQSAGVFKTHFFLGGGGGGVTILPVFVVPLNTFASPGRGGVGHVACLMCCFYKHAGAGVACSSCFVSAASLGGIRHLAGLVSTAYLMSSPPALLSLKPFFPFCHCFSDLQGVGLSRRTQQGVNQSESRYQV